MNLNSLFQSSTELKGLQKSIDEGFSPILLYGAQPSDYRWIAASLQKNMGRDVLVFFEEESAARQSAAIIEGAYYLPLREKSYGPAIAYTRSGEISRTEALIKISEAAGSRLLFTSILSAGQKIKLQNKYKKFNIKSGAKLDMQELIDELAGSGYERCDYVEEKGEFSIRGGIADIFSLMSDRPIRIEFFGDDIDSIRYFDIEDQISTENTDSASIYLAQESPDEFMGILSLLHNPLVFVIGSNSCFARLKNNVTEGEDSYGFNEIIEKLHDCTVINTEIIQKQIQHFPPSEIVKFASREVGTYYGNLQTMLSDLRRYQFSGYRILISFFTDSRRDHFINLLRTAEYDGAYRLADRPADIKDIAPAEIVLTVSAADEGFFFESFKSILYTEPNIYATKRRQRRRSSRASSRSIKALLELTPGDHVVHIEHGIGKFIGVEQITIKHNRRDFFKIRYHGGDHLYVPVESAGSIQKYIGSNQDSIKLNRMGSSQWAKSVQKTKKNIEDIADELIELYAKRQSQTGYAFSPDGIWQTEFEEQFPFEETADQLKSTAEIKADMEKPVPMDRLLCGDVGYGKTEVALRAAFKSVSDSKQVAILVPTTVLAQQHYSNLTARFSKYPVRVEAISRFRSKKEISDILKRLALGEVDIIIGTHRLLSKDVRFKDLGLLVIDEEQRFGVKHKEKIKVLKDRIDVLTLTATPIPRTLHMSMIGVRDMSVLEDPPEDRYPVQTYVLEYDEDTVAEAIKQELARGGQVYFVHNRIATIDKVAARISEILPGASIRHAHGQMPEAELEQIMLDFTSGEFSVLVSTTIIETGLDISNVNTIIIDGGDQMGLSQLYQLRGRVGRSSRTAYCFVFFRRGKILSEVAEKRLRAIREFTELGAGFKIAMRDLEIRGAGNMLGTAQSGFMNAVGYDMYCSLLDEAIRNRKGETVKERIDTKLELRVNAFIPEKYISHAPTRVDIYKNIASISSADDKIKVYSELQDRFGDVPNEVSELLSLAYIKAMCENMGVSEIAKTNTGYRLKFPVDAQVNMYFISLVVNHDRSKWEFVANNPCELRLNMRRKVMTDSEPPAVLEKELEAIYSLVKDDIKEEKFEN